MRKGRIIEPAPLVSTRQERADKDESRFDNARIRCGLRQFAYSAAEDLFIGPRRLVYDGSRRCSLVTAANEFTRQLIEKSRTQEMIIVARWAL